MDDFARRRARVGEGAEPERHVDALGHEVLVAVVRHELDLQRRVLLHKRGKPRDDFPEGHASDPKREAAVQFARKVIETRGKVSDADLKAVRDAGYTDANVIEIVALVAMYSLTNFFNNVFDPEKDFPAVTRAGSI